MGKVGSVGCLCLPEWLFPRWESVPQMGAYFGCDCLCIPQFVLRISASSMG